MACGCQAPTGCGCGPIAGPGHAPTSQRSARLGALPDGLDRLARPGAPSKHGGAPARLQDRQALAGPGDDGTQDCGEGGPTERPVLLRASHAIPPPPPRPSNRVLLMPGLSVPVPRDGNLAGVDWAKLLNDGAERGELLFPPSSLRLRASGARAEDGECAKEPGAGGRSGLWSERLTPTRHRRERARPGAPPSIDLPDDPPSVGGAVGPGSGGPVWGGAAAICTTLTWRYRRVGFCWDSDFLDFILEWTPWYQLLRRLSFEPGHGTATAGLGLVSSVEATIARYWPSLAESGSSVDAEALLGCYNLPRGGWDFLQRYLFWPFGKGAPYEVHRWTANLLYQHTSFLDYETGTLFGEASDAFIFPGADECIGMEGFVRRLLRGGRPLRRAGDERCHLTIEYRSTDLRMPGPLSDTCAYRLEDPDSTDCTRGFPYPGDDGWSYGLPWDGWSSWWNQQHHCFNADVDFDGCTAPSLGTISFRARHRWWAVEMHASELAFQGVTCDYLMHWARMLADYSDWLRARGGVDDADKAEEMDEVGSQVARYALGVIATNAGTWIHEIGHAWLSGSQGSLGLERYRDYRGHCDYNCCMDIAKGLWWCRVRALLGLPDGQYQSTGRDYSGSTQAAGPVAHWCSTEPGVDIVTNCRIEQGGTAGSRSWFCSSGCMINWGPLHGFGDYLVSFDPDRLLTTTQFDSICSSSWAPF